MWSVLCIFICKCCKFGDKNLQQFQRYRIFPRGLLFLARPVDVKAGSVRDVILAFNLILAWLQMLNMKWVLLVLCE